MTDMTLSLETRNGLPEALRVLIDEYPRASWEHDPGFEGLLRFWLDRHLMFRRLLKQMIEDSEKYLNQDMSAKFFAAHLSRYGGMFVQELHGHHTIEDQHYFPKLIGLDDRLARGFEILDKDHHALDGHLNTFVETANHTLGHLNERTKMTAAAEDFRNQLVRLEGFLNRHLIDEEELVVPVVLKFGAPDV